VLPRDPHTRRAAQKEKALCSRQPARRKLRRNRRPASARARLEEEEKAGDHVHTKGSTSPTGLVAAKRKKGGENLPLHPSGEKEKDYLS